MIIVRKLRKNDYEGFYKLEEEFRDYNNSLERSDFLKYKLNKKQNKKAFLEMLKDRNHLALGLEDIVEKENKLVGFFIGKIKSGNGGGYIYNLDKTGYIENVFISKNYRGKGYFKGMLNLFLLFLKNRKIKYCSLHVDASNELAINAYKKLGFKGPIQYKFFLELK